MSSRSIPTSHTRRARLRLPTSASAPRGRPGTRDPGAARVRAPPLRGQSCGLLDPACLAPSRHLLSDGSGSPHLGHLGLGCCCEVARAPRRNSAEISWSSGDMLEDYLIGCELPPPSGEAVEAAFTIRQGLALAASTLVLLGRVGIAVLGCGLLPVALSPCARAHRGCPCGLDVDDHSLILSVSPAEAVYASVRASSSVSGVSPPAPSVRGRERRSGGLREHSPPLLP